MVVDRAAVSSRRYPLFHAQWVVGGAHRGGGFAPLRVEVWSSDGAAAHHHKEERLSDDAPLMRVTVTDARCSASSGSTA